MNQSEDKTMSRSRRKERELPYDQSQSDFKLVLVLIGWKDDASFGNESQSKASQNQSKHELLSTLGWKPL